MRWLPTGAPLMLAVSPQSFAQGSFVLIDDGVRSGKELVAAIIKHEHLGTLVGSRTAGAFLGGSPASLFDGKYLVYVAVGAWFPSEIGPLEHVGVQPDVAVPACRQGCRGRDAQLQAALDLVSRLPGRQPHSFRHPLIAWHRLPASLPCAHRGLTRIAGAFS